MVLEAVAADAARGTRKDEEAPAVDEVEITALPMFQPAQLPRMSLPPPHEHTLSDPGPQPRNLPTRTTMLRSASSAQTPSLTTRLRLATTPPATSVGFA